MFFFATFATFQSCSTGSSISSVAENFYLYSVAATVFSSMMWE